MRASMAMTAMVMLAVLLGASPGLAQEPTDPGPTKHERAIEAVRTFDPRFAVIDTLEQARARAAQDFDQSSVLAGSWIRVVPTYASAFGDFHVEAPAWLDTGPTIVEVLLVEDCGPLPDEIVAQTADPCRARRTWLFEVLGSGAVRELSTVVITDG
ncbi:MAG: hypothetical protein KF809_08510 [Chloroflexi bacterium]|nr:hypothetical protein [Chloroflexota bacterium]